MKELIAEREALTATLDEALATKNEAAEAHRAAKDAVLAFDEAHPEVMREVNFQKGQAKRAAKAAAAESAEGEE